MISKTKFICINNKESLFGSVYNGETETPL